VRTREPEVIEDREAVARRIRQAIAAVLIVPASEFLRQAHVTIVIHDDKGAAVNKFLTEALAPADQLPGEALNKQNGDTAARSSGFIIDLHIALGCWHLMFSN
jgi:hypothetical protein